MLPLIFSFLKCKTKKFTFFIVKFDLAFGDIQERKEYGLRFHAEFKK